MELWLILLFGGIMFFGMLVLLLVLYNRGYMQQLPLQWTGMRYAHDSEPGPIGYENVQIVEETQGAQATRHTKTYAIQPRKTLWDWLQLFLIPLVLALVAVAFNAGQASTSQQLAEQSKQEQVVDNYLNQMSTLLMQYHLHDSQVVDPVRALAQAITLTALDRLDGQHKNIIILFLYRSDILKYHYFKHGETECGDPKVLQKRFSDEQPIITLAQGNVSEVTINNLKLTCIDLHNTHLERSNFATSDLDRADLGLSLAMNADFSYASLYAANMYYLDLENAHLQGANLQYANMEGICLSHARLDGAYLQHASLRVHKHAVNDVALFCGKPENDTMTPANLSNAVLTNADLTSADLTQAILTGADLRGTNLSGAMLDKIVLKGARYNSKEILVKDSQGNNLIDILPTAWPQGFNPKAMEVTENNTLSGANLSGATLLGANLSDTDLSGANLSGASFNGADLSGANLRNAKITQAQLKEAKSLKNAIMPDGSKHP